MKRDTQPLIQDETNSEETKPAELSTDSEGEILPKKSQVIVEYEYSEQGLKRNRIVILIIAVSLGFTTFPTLSMNLFFKDDLHLQPAEMSLFNSILNFIWILKPVFGFICDSYPIFGSHRKAYLIIFSLVAILSWILLSTWVTTLAQAILVKTMINVSTNFCNVIGEAIMVETSQTVSQKQEREKQSAKEYCVSDQKESTLAYYDNKKAATNVSLYLSLTAASTLISSFFGGYLLNFLSKRQIFLLSAIFPLSTFLAGFLAFEFSKTTRGGEVQRQRFCQLAQHNAQKVWKFLRLPFIYKPIIFIFLVVIAPGVDDAMFYYNSNVLNFSYDNFALVNVIDSIGNILGVWTYRLGFTSFSFKNILFITTICFSITQSSKLMITQNLTYEVLDLSPVSYTYITSWLYSFVNELHLMPLMVLACKMCPKSVEATFYSFVLAIINFGYLVSYWLGGLLTWSLNITSTNFQNLWILIVIASAFPLITLIFLIVLPNKFDVNQQIEQYFKQKATQHRTSIQRESFSQKAKGRTNIRDCIDNERLLVDREERKE